jgi:hypothetical protein
MGLAGFHEPSSDVAEEIARLAAANAQMKGERP